MSEIKIHIMHTGSVCVAPELPYGGEDCSTVKASGFFEKKEDRIWLPVSCYLIESRHGRILFDCGWHRDMSPEGLFDKHAQIKSLGSSLLYKINQGILPLGEAVDEQLAAMNIRPEDLSLVLLSHLDCDHVNGLKLVKGAKRIFTSMDEIAFAYKKTPVNQVRYQRVWWADTRLKGFRITGTEGPNGKSFDLYGDGSFVMVNIPGHSEGMCALKITGEDGRFVLLCADGAYGKRSYEEMILPGIADDREKQKKSLEWIREMSEKENCVAVLASHDPDVEPGVITLS